MNPSFVTGFDLRNVVLLKAVWRKYNSSGMYNESVKRISHILQFKISRIIIHYSQCRMFVIYRE